MINFIVFNNRLTNFRKIDSFLFLLVASTKYLNKKSFSFLLRNLFLNKIFFSFLLRKLLPFLNKLFFSFLLTNYFFCLARESNPRSPPHNFFFHHSTIEPSEKDHFFAHTCKTLFLSAFFAMINLFLLIYLFLFLM